MPVTLTSPVEGLKVGDTYTGEREDWLVVNGYASRPGNFDGLHATDLDASQDPTLAANREDPPVQGGDVDAVEAEDGEAILAFDYKDRELEDELLEVAPQARLVPAGLEDTDPRVHGTTLIDGTSYGEDKLTAEINGSAEAAKPAEGNPVLEVAPQADARAREELAEEVQHESEEVATRTATVLERAESEIPETAANVGQSQPKPKTRRRQAAKDADEQ